LLQLKDEIEEALLHNPRAPIVALESTLLAHGLPPKRRLEVGLELERIVRAQGGVPATIAVLDGKMCVGLREQQLIRLTTEPAKKASVRDLCVALSMGGVWATTVASTMHIATAAKIRIFATGGIGGVHRGAKDSFDESADLVALARYPVAVVSAGAKAILDLSATYQRLESLGVPVLGFNTAHFPAFYSASTQIELFHHFTHVSAIAQILQQRFNVLNQGGVLVVQNPPAAFAQDSAQVEAMVEDALNQAKQAGITGARLTPYLLNRLDESSGGAMVETNIALVEQNASLAARIAVAATKSL